LKGEKAYSQGLAGLPGMPVEPLQFLAAGVISILVLKIHQMDIE